MSIEPTPQFASTREVGNHSILLVENDSAVRQALGKVAREAGYSVTLATDGTEALSILEKDGPAMLVLDLDLPECEGWNVLEHSLAQNPARPVVLITSFSDQCESGVLPGPGALIEKPIEPASFLGLLGKLTNDLALKDPVLTNPSHCSSGSCATLTVPVSHAYREISFSPPIWSGVSLLK